MHNKTADAINCISYFQVKPHYLEKCIAALLKLVPLTRAEPGCLQYELIQDDKDPNFLIMVEKFVSKAAFAEHDQQAYIKKFVTEEMDLYCEKVWWHLGQELLHNGKTVP